MRIAVVVGLLCLACRPEPAPDPPILDTSVASPKSQPPPLVPVAQGSRLPCPVDFGPEAETILVAGQPTPIAFEVGIDARLVAYPAAEGEVLVAIGYDHPWYFDRTDTGASLWRVHCTEPAKAERALELPGAEFPWSAPSPDGDHIYFSYQGVHAYAIATGEVTRVLSPRRIADCWADEEGVDSEDLVQGWVRPGELLVLSGGPCGFEAEWQGEAQVVTNLRDSRRPAERRPRAWIGALATGAGDRVWVGDGGECKLEFAPQQIGTPGVWRSDDAGESWSFLPMHGVEVGIWAIWPSERDPDRILAATECCDDGGADECEGAGGGSLFLTTDGGRIWRKILDESQDYGIEAMLVLDDAEHEMLAFGKSHTFFTRDDGRTWAPSSTNLEGPVDPRARVESGGFVLEPSEDGLERRASNAAPGTGAIVLRPGLEEDR